VFVAKSRPQSTRRYAAQPPATTKLSEGTARKPGRKTLLFLSWLPGFLSGLLFAEADAADCDLNGVDDVVAIATGVSADCNSNGIPDACDVVPLVFGTRGDPLTLGGVPRALTSGDLDGDGVRDLVVGTDSGLSLFFSRGASDFAPELTVSTDAPLAVATADLDADGDLELVTAYGDVLQVHPGDGRGGFATAVEVATSPGTEQLVVADIDLDGVADLLTLSPSQGSVTLHRDWGEGRFDKQYTFEVAQPLGNTSLVRLLLEAADFDGDGDLDLAVAGGRELSVSILETVLADGKSGGVSFTVAHSFRAARPVQAFAVGDLNVDGRADLLVTTLRGATTVFLNQLDHKEMGGGFAEVAALALDFDTLALSDVDGDAALDLVLGVRDRAGTTIQVYRGQIHQDPGDGTFLSSQSFAAEGTLLRVDDLSGDGRADLAVAAAGRVKILVQGERQGLVLEGVVYRTADWPHFIDVGHLNGDAFPDVITTNADLATFTIFPGRGDGSLGEPRLTNLGVSLPAGVAVDLNEDGVDDLVLRLGRQDEGRRGFFVLLNRGEGEFGEPDFVPSAGGSPRGGGDDPQFLAKADVDGDHRVDVLAPGWESDLLSVHFNDGRGGLDEEVVLTVGTRPWAATAGDLDDDGDLDLVTSNGLTSDLSILLQQSPREFAPQISVPVIGGARSVALGDLNGDGHLDVVTASGPGGGSVNVFAGRGDGTVEPVPQRTELGRDPIGVIVTDVDQDGFLDVVTTDHQAEESLSVLLGRGDGTFSRAQGFGAGNEPRFTVGADFDLDGDVDFVTGHRAFRFRGNPDVFVLLNQIAAPVPSEEFLTTICTMLDFESVSVPLVGPLAGPLVGPLAGPLVGPLAGPLAERRTKYLLPAREDPALLSTLFLNVVRFPRELDFLRDVFADRFGDLSEMGFGELALRRASREYFTGDIRRLRLDDGSTAYGFDVLTDAMEPQELLSLDATREVLRRLRESFRLEPLVYFPTTSAARESAKGWNAPDLPLVIVEETSEPEPPDNPTFRLEIPADTFLCGVFAVAGSGRGVQEELELKSRVRLRSGSVLLPTASETFSANLFEEVLFGPDAVAAESQGPGSGGVLRVPGPARQRLTTYRFTYSQLFALPDGSTLELEVVSPLQFRAQGDEPLDESQTLPEDFFVVLKGREPLQAALDGVPLVRYGSCTYDALATFEIEAELADTAGEGSGVLRLEERFEEAKSEFDTAPASVARAELSLGGEERIVTDYFKLVYSASRHNRAVDYWIVLDPPVAIEGLGAVHVVELRAPESFRELQREASAAYLGADLEVLVRPMVTRFTRIPRSEARFLRGDAGGDAVLDVADAIGLLRYLFERQTLPCLSAADANDDGRINIIDPLAVVSTLFGRRGDLPEPFPGCGDDPTEDGLSCRSAAPCL
jgi:hypothetical protein